MAAPNAHDIDASTGSAQVLTFVIEGGAGAERVSTFLRRVRLEKEIASSPTALRKYINKVEELLAQYGKAQEQAQQGKLRCPELVEGKHLVAGGDETFFRDSLMLRQAQHKYWY